MNNASGHGQEAVITKPTTEKESEGHVGEAATTKSTFRREFSETAGGPQEVTRRGKLAEI